MPSGDASRRSVDGRNTLPELTTRPPFRERSIPSSCTKNVMMPAGGGGKDYSSDANTDAAALASLDGFLRSNACFSAPSSAAAAPARSWRKQKQQKTVAAADGYWSDFAPSLEGYNGVLAKVIAAGTGQLVKGIFMCSEAYASQVQRGADLFRPQAAGSASNRFGTTSQASTKRGAVNTSLKRVRKTPELVGALPLVPPVRRRAGAPWGAGLHLCRPLVELAQLRLVVPAAEHGGRRRGHQRRQIRGRELLQDGLLRLQRQGCRRRGGGGRGGLPVLEQRPEAEIATGILGFPSWSRAASRPRLPVLVPERPRRPSCPGEAWATYPEGKA